MDTRLVRTRVGGQNLTPVPSRPVPSVTFLNHELGLVGQSDADARPMRRRRRRRRRRERRDGEPGARATAASVKLAAGVFEPDANEQSASGGVAKRRRVYDGGVRPIGL